MRREAHETASESCEKTRWGAPECPEKLSQVKSRPRFLREASPQCRTWRPCGNLRSRLASEWLLPVSGEYGASSGVGSVMQYS